MHALGRRKQLRAPCVLGRHVAEEELPHVPLRSIAEEGLYALPRFPSGMVTTERLRVPGRRIVVGRHDGGRGGAIMVARA